MRATWLPWGLALVLGGLLVWFLVLRGNEPVELDLDTFSAPAWAMDAERIVYESGGDSIVVERRGERFEIVHPISDHADPTRLLQTLQAAMQLRPTRALPAEDLGAFGLRPPRHRLAFGTPAGQRWSIAIGDTVPIGGRVYAHVESSSEPNMVLLLREFGARRDFFPSADQLRDRVALPLESPVVDSIHVDAGPYRLRAVRNSGNTWTSLAPEGLELDPLPIHKALRLLRTPSIREFAPPGADPADYGLDRPRATWVVFVNAQAETVKVGAATPEADGIFVQPAGRSVIADLPADAYRELVDGWPGLASRRLSYYEASEVDRIEFPGSEVAYVRADSGWVRLPEGRLVRNGPSLVRDLENLLALQWEAYPLDGARPEGRADSIQIRVVPGPNPSRELPPFVHGPDLLTLAGPAENGAVFARTNRRELWGRVPDGAYRVWSYRRSHADL